MSRIAAFVFGGPAFFSSGSHALVGIAHVLHRIRSDASDRFLSDDRINPLHPDPTLVADTAITCCAPPIAQTFEVLRAGLGPTVGFSKTMLPLMTKHGYKLTGSFSGVHYAHYYEWKPNLSVAINKYAAAYEFYAKATKNLADAVREKGQYDAQAIWEKA